MLKGLANGIFVQVETAQCVHDTRRDTRPHCQVTSQLGGEGVDYARKHMTVQFILLWKTTPVKGFHWNSQESWVNNERHISTLQIAVAIGKWNIMGFLKTSTIKNLKSSLKWCQCALHFSLSPFFPPLILFFLWDCDSQTGISLWFTKTVKIISLNSYQFMENGRPLCARHPISFC